MTPGPEDDVSQDEKRRIIRDQSRNGDTGTYLSHTHADEISGGGRFAAVSPATIVGQDPQMKYPQLPSSSPWHGSDPVPDEPPLGYPIDAMSEFDSSAAASAEATGGAEAPSTPASAPDVEHAAPPFSSDEPKDDGNDAT
jgi:hypothetical protein